MDIQFYGANCITLITKHARLVVDDNLTELGGNSITKPGDIVLFTGSHGNIKSQPKITIDQPGEYEVSGVNVNGIAARASIDGPKTFNATIYKITTDDLRILVTGHIYPELSEDQLESIGTVDIILIPIGGHGYTLDATGALKVIKDIEPKLAIPTHFDDPKLKYPVPQATLEEGLKNLAMEPKEKVPKLRIKPADLSDTTQLVVIEPND